MKAKVFVDTNVFIYGFEYPQSNSAKILNLIESSDIKGVICEQVLKEVVKYFEKYHNIELARIFRRFLLEYFQLVPTEQIKKTMLNYQEQIKGKDLQQIAATKHLGLKYLIAYDRDFDPFEEYIKPKQFIQLMNRKTANTEY